MGHGAATNSIEVESPKDFDRVARRWNVDYAFYKTGPDKYLLFFKSGQADTVPLNLFPEECVWILPFTTPTAAIPIVILCLSTKTGYKLLKDGKIECLKIGRAYRIPKAYILRYLQISGNATAE